MLNYLFNNQLNYYKNDIKRFISAIKIQSTYRGYITRRIYGKILENNKKKLQYNSIPIYKENYNLQSNIDLFINNRKSLLDYIQK